MWSRPATTDWLFSRPPDSFLESCRLPSASSRKWQRFDALVPASVAYLVIQALLLNTQAPAAREENCTKSKTKRPMLPNARRFDVKPWRQEEFGTEKLVVLEWISLCFCVHIKPGIYDMPVDMMSLPIDFRCIFLKSALKNEGNITQRSGLYRLQWEGRTMTAANHWNAGKNIRRQTVAAGPKTPSPITVLIS